LSSVPFHLAAVVYLPLFLIGDRLLSDPDIYWHLVVGQWIIENHAVPHADMFSYTFAGTPWIAKEWLSQVIYAGAFAVGGWAGMVVVAVGSIVTSFALLSRFLLQRLALAPALLLTAAALAMSAPHFLARPHALAYPLMVIWGGGLVRALDEGRPPSPWLLLVMVLWANLHGGFTVGLLLVAPAGLEAVIAAKAGQRRDVAIRWASFALLASIAACITPYGPGSMLITYRILNLGQALLFISEWQALHFNQISAFEVCVLLGIGFALYRGLTLPLLRIVVILGLLHLALVHARNIELAGMLAPMFIAVPLARQVGTPRPEAEGPRLHPLVNGAIAALLIVVTLSVSAFHSFAMRAEISPVEAVRVLKEMKAGPVFNDYNFGGYLIYAGVPTFIDGRAELYGEEFLMRDFKAANLRDVGDFLRLLDDYHIGATLLGPDTPLVTLLDHLTNWKRVHADEIAVVHVRQPGEPGFR
jgi:hypothetical protein